MRIEELTLHPEEWKTIQKGKIYSHTGTRRYYIVSTCSNCHKTCLVRKGDVDALNFCSRGCASTYHFEQARHTLLITGKKRCTICKQEKPLEDFNKARGTTLQATCKTCTREYHRLKYTNSYREPMLIKLCEKRKVDFKWKLSTNICASIRSSLKRNGGSKNGRHWESLVGYTLEDLRKHLEGKFTPEMSWENQGKYWVIDHKVPISKFKFRSHEDPQFKMCFSLENLHPLEKNANSRKHNIISEEFGNVELARKFGVID